MNKLKGTIGKTPKLRGEIKAQIVTVGTGKDGATFIPAVSEDGVISWTNDKGLENPKPVNIKGPRGEDYVLTEADKEEIAEMAAEKVVTPDIPKGTASEDWVNENFQPKGNYLEEVPEGYVTDTELNAKGFQTAQQVEDYAQPKGDYVTKTALEQKGYQTTQQADNTYQPKGSYATETQLENVEKKIPTKNSQLENDSKYVKQSELPTSLPASDVPEWAKNPEPPKYNKSDVGLSNVANERQYSENNPPPYPVTSVNGQGGNVEVEPKGTAAGRVQAHNNSTDSHPDIRDAIPQKTSQLENDSNFLDDSGLQEAIDSAIEDAMESGELKGQRGTGILKVTSSLTSYTTTTNGKNPIKRMSLATIKKEAGVNEVLVGDLISYSYYHYHIYYIDATYAYMDTYVSIRGATGATGAKGDDGKGFDWIHSVEDYGAVGNGSTDDTTAFRNALSANRTVFVPNGTYELNGELVIRDNCQLELAQDVVLNFTNTSGNCITLNRSAFLKGNHATIKVPYAFTGKVINVDTTVHTDTKDVPPFIHWDPQWKTARYLTDLNICKADSYGVHRSTSGDSNGTAVYISANGSATSTFIWGLNFSGLRIAGAFEYGIRAITLGSGYNHEMRIEAFMDACKIGVSLEDCNNAYISATIQPRKAENGTVYAKHGIQLVRSENTDLSGSRVWDWNDANSLWTYDKTNINQHIAMYGNCRGTIMNDYNYYHIPSGFNDLRELIYTDTASNFNSLIILQEPFTRWFKPVNNEPYFVSGDGDKRLIFKEEQDALFQTDYVPQFTDQLAKASDGAGAIFNEIGYKKGYYWAYNGESLTSSNWHTCTGFVPCKAGSIIRVKGMSFASGNDDCRIVMYDVNFNKVQHVNRGGLIGNGSYFAGYVETDDGFIMEIKNPATVAYITFSVYTSTVSANPIITVDEEITYTQEGFLADGINIKESNIIGMDKYERIGRMTTAISSASTDNQYPTAKAVYKAIQDFLGVVENGTY